MTYPRPFAAVGTLVVCVATTAAVVTLRHVHVTPESVVSISYEVSVVGRPPRSVVVSLAPFRFTKNRFPVVFTRRYAPLAVSDADYATVLTAANAAYEAEVLKAAAEAAAKAAQIA